MSFKSFKLKEGHKISFYRGFYDPNPIIYITSEPCLPENIRINTSIISIQTLNTNTEILKNITCLLNDIQPVCGKNGSDYINECYSYKAGTEIAYNGQCSFVSPSSQSITLTPQQSPLSPPVVQQPQYQQQPQNQHIDYSIFQDIDLLQSEHLLLCK
jgi:hypothetical protein